MKRRVWEVLWFALVGGLSLALFVWLQPADRDSSVLNRGWNGLSEASSELNASPLVSYDGLEDVPLPATLVLMPRLPLTQHTLEAIDVFTRSGGTLVVLDDFGYGNEVLSYLGVDIRFHGAALADPLYCYRHASMPRVEFARMGDTHPPGVMVLNQATWLEVGRGVDVWARSSYFSYGDINGDGRRGAGDPDGPLPVGASVARESGRVIAVSDSSLLINSMVVLADNVYSLSRFVAGEVLIDQLHLPEVQTDRGKGALARLRATLADGAGITVVVLLASAFAVGYAWYNRGRYEHD